MANLKEIRIRISSVESTKQITSAMKLVAASKLKRAQDAITTMRPYAEKLGEILQDISSGNSNEDNVYGVQREEEKVLLVPISSNRGLCGAFNANVIKKCNVLLANDYKNQNARGDVHFFTVGKKVSEHFTKHGATVIASHDDIWDNLAWENVIPIAEDLLKLFRDGDYDRIELVYNEFVNAATQKLNAEQFLPVVENSVEGESNKDYIMEPSSEVIIGELIPKTLKTQFYKALLDSLASEHGARMTAMHQATDNADALVKDLKLTYNKARQTAITNEIIEIVSGADAM
ncbi:MAG: ATP synthase F1 subunit gamma [Bacteroidetes bacterium 4572_112]|nr:MAG: ATP synthase F1 subunit gamma [Bacteroidetes bacterium 4572_112]